MPSPIRPSEICALVPSGTSSLCDRLLKVFIQLPAKICAWATWMFNEDGTLTDDFKNEAQIIPVGMIMWHTSSVIPSGWLELNGQEVSRTLYPALFALLGTKYGAGNGTTSFKLPDLRDRVLMGRSATRAIGDTGGEAEHTLTAPEGAASLEHQHVYGRATFLDNNDDYILASGAVAEPFTGASALSGLGLQGAGGSGANVPSPLGTGGSGRYMVTSEGYVAGTPASTEPHNNLQPFFVAVPCIKT